MPDGEATAAGSRSDKRIPKLRTRGRANREKLLAAAQQLLEENGGRSVRFREVFEAAQVSRGSAYRIYDGIEDLMHDLARSWTSKFVAYVEAGTPIAQPETWVELADHMVARAAAYWVETAETLRVLPLVRSKAPESYRAAVRDLSKAMADTFERYFEMPEIPDWQSVLAMYTSLGDMVFADAVRREGSISEERLLQAQKICNTYLSFYLPASLPARGRDT